jgi:hypothetical protein
VRKIVKPVRGSGNKKVGQAYPGLNCIGSGRLQHLLLGHIVGRSGCGQFVRGGIKKGRLVRKHLEGEGSARLERHSGSKSIQGWVRQALGKLEASHLAGDILVAVVPGRGCGKDFGQLRHRDTPGRASGKRRHRQQREQYRLAHVLETTPPCRIALYLRRTPRPKSRQHYRRKSLLPVRNPPQALTICMLNSTH